MARKIPYIAEIEKYYTAFGKLHHSHVTLLNKRIGERGGIAPSDPKELILEAKRLGVQE